MAPKMEGTWLSWLKGWLRNYLYGDRRQQGRGRRKREDKESGMGGWERNFVSTIVLASMRGDKTRGAKDIIHSLIALTFHALLT
jgi:hypothetical protein